MRALWFVGVVAAVLVGCGDKDDDDSGGGGADSGVSTGGGTGGDGGGAGGGTGGGDDGGGTGGTDTCEELTPEACGGRDDCVGIDGRTMQDDGAGGLCVDFSEPQTVLGCMTADMGCGDAETLAADPADPSTCWWFSSTCVPSGWTACETSEYGECAR